jgi:uncharacterized membrane-anchored protein
MRKITERAIPSVAAIQTEAARTEAMIAAATQRIESAEKDLRTAMHLQFCRAELHAYLAGLMYSLGYTDLMDRQTVGSEFGLSEVQVDGFEDPTRPGDEDAPRFMECFEC